MEKLALCVIATGRYTDFVPQLVESAGTHLLLDHDVHVFSDSVVQHELVDHRHYVEHQPWPYSTLMRYHFIKSQRETLKHYSHIYYCDVDMRFVHNVGTEILGDLVCVQHPGYYRGGGSWESRPESTAFVNYLMRKRYVAGGFQGGRSDKFLMLCDELAQRIDNDTRRGLCAVWHDESYLNAYYAYHHQAFKVLDPSYCMVEEKSKRKAWGIDHFRPHILALDKDHNAYRQ